MFCKYHIHLCHQLNAKFSWSVIADNYAERPTCVCSPLVCCNFHVLCFLKSHQKDPIKKKQNDGLIVPSVTKRFEYLSHDFKYVFPPVNFSGGKKVGWYLKSCSMFGSDFWLRTFLKWSYHKSLSNHELLKVCIIKKIRKTALSTNNIIFYQNWLVHPMCLKYFV